MKKFLIPFLLLLMVAGCASHTDLDTQIQKAEKIQIVTTTVSTPIAQEKSKNIFQEFPFILGDYEIRGKFSDKFYDNLHFVYTARPIEKVDFWRLQKEPKSIDFIYVSPVWIRDFKKVSSNLFEDLCYSYNISKQEQDILKQWVAKGGVLWLESGTYSTKYDIFNRRGEIATAKINRLIRQSLQGVRFWDRPIKHYLFASHDLDPINYVPSSYIFQVDSNRSIFKDIKRLKIDIQNYLQNNFVVLAKPLVVDTKGRPLVTLMKYGKGYVVSLLPFEYKDVYYDGELLRWELLFYIYNLR